MALRVFLCTPSMGAIYRVEVPNGEGSEDIMDMGLEQWIYSPSLRYVVEFCHDEVITIGWI